MMPAIRTPPRPFVRGGEDEPATPPSGVEVSEAQFVGGSEDDEPQVNDDSPSSNTDTTHTSCCAWWSFDGVAIAAGYNQIGIARGAVVMSNIFLATSLIFLASEEAGCLILNEDGEEEIDEDCDNKVRGFRPSSLITNIAVFSGLLSAFFMPLIGAVVDYTPHRRRLGLASAAVLVLIQGAQIYTVSSTWFPMAILQALAGFVYQVQVLTNYAYLPEISSKVGESKMTKFTATFTMVQFAAQATFLIVVIAISFGFDSWGDVETAHFSQATVVLWATLWFGMGWNKMEHAPARRVLQEGDRLVTQGFVQNWHTAVSIHREYSHGLQWYFLALIFAEAAVAALTSVSVVYLDESLGMSSEEIGIFFLVTLVATLPGSKLGAYVTHKTNPNTSWKWSMVVLSAIMIVGALALDGLERTELAYVWGLFVGLDLGWFYPTENLFFSMILPKGQEAELAGFFVYCSQILVWLPPLVFTFLVEWGVNQKWGVISVTVFFAIAVGFLFCTASWPDILEESQKIKGLSTAPEDVEENLVQGEEESEILGQDDGVFDDITKDKEESSPEGEALGES